MTNEHTLSKLESTITTLIDLCEEVKCQSSSMELRKEYETLIHQATNSLNQIHSIASNDQFIRVGWKHKLLEQ